MRRGKYTYCLVAPEPISRPFQVYTIAQFLLRCSPPSPRSLSGLTASEIMARAPNASQPHFLHWFPQMGPGFKWLLLNDCWDDYQFYLNQQYHNAVIDSPNSKNCASCAIGPVAACLYDNYSSLSKANMAAAGVLLGLLPTMLLIACASKVETGVLALRRPFFATLISLASIGLCPLPALDHDAFKVVLRLRAGRMRQWIPARNTITETLVTGLQYLVVLAAIVNIVEVTYELCYWTICSIAPATVTLPWLYPGLSLIAHFLAARAVKLCLRIQPDSDDHGNTLSGSLRSRLSDWISREIHLAGSTSDRSSHQALCLKLQHETYAFVIANWLTSIFALGHLLLGTLVFSSILFISTADAALVVFRYLISTIVVRIVLAYELCSLGDQIDVNAQIQIPTNEGKVSSRVQAKSGVVFLRGRPV